MEVKSGTRPNMLACVAKYVLINTAAIAAVVVVFRVAAGDSGSGRAAHCLGAGQPGVRSVFDGGDWGVHPGDGEGRRGVAASPGQSCWGLGHGWFDFHVCLSNGGSRGVTPLTSPPLLLFLCSSPQNFC